MKPKPFEKFSKHLRFALHQAAYLAAKLGHPTIEPAHIVVAFCKTDGALAAELLQNTKLRPDELEAQLRGNDSDTVITAHAVNPLFSKRVEKQLLSATTIAYRAQHPYVGTEHLLSAIVEDPGPELEAFLTRTTGTTNAVKEQLDMIFRSGSKLGELTETFTDDVAGDLADDSDDLPPATKSFGTHLTSVEKAADLDPVIGREQEIDRLMQILVRRTKNNPVLLGDPGVGKTAIVEGLAKRISRGDVPPALRRKKIVALDLGSLVAGTMFRGEFENRMKQLIEEMKHNPDVILFIDELHTIVGAGAAAGSIDAANLLKPALARGELRCIGATTLEEYRRSIESDGALERRFQPIYVGEPTASQTKLILNGLKKNYESYHGLTITEEALEAAVALSERYLTERFLPDKAIDLLDEAAARVRVQSTPPPDLSRLHELEEDERLALRRKEVATAKEQFEDAIHWKQEAERLTAKKILLEADLKKNPPQYPNVGRDTIIEVLTSWTNVPVADLVREEREHLINFEEHLGAHVIGQTEARKTVADTIRRSRLGLSDRNRPLASFLFVGPTGVGKTTLAKAIARALFGDEKALLTIDMSEYSEGHTVSKLIGAPAGYVGYKESGLLTERVRRRPYQVILFDELDRAHRDVYQLLLQILAEGSLRDASGRLVNFKQTIVVATMNPLKHDSQSLGFGETGSEAMNTVRVTEAVRDILPAELIQRFDAMLALSELSREALGELLEKELNVLNERLKIRGLSVTIPETSRAQLIDECLRDRSGARGLGRKLQTLVESNIATHLLAPKRSKKTVFTLAREKSGWKLR